ncbi:molybdenum transport protein [Acetitomaculum ruminis DSM 5522]|uniref:Putative pyrophosphorylase ModD n=1 Tax=Acetitomaculum ruminis DSM 5522 TaxID=1120918 RepID=A0A1I0WN59_9FIRM|nr:ModD protein [Acetitomaculum ruminis]SFA90215.1 molybdenum transport protein [Acetitomaculum ruminis DSM 5522]
MYLANVNFEALIREDVPYFDLTAFELGLDHEKARISCFTREECVVCATEEAREIFKRLGIETTKIKYSGEWAKPNEELIVGTGQATEVITAWKVIQNLIDHTSAIATKTRKLVDEAHSVKSDLAILTTRKMFSGTKALSIKATMAGGALPHRLGTSETILVFKQHLNLLGGFDKFLEKLPKMKHSCVEKKILFETSDVKEAEKCLEAGVDGIQIEKLKPEELVEFCEKIRQKYPNAVLLAAGGINEKNVREYAKASIDGIVTTSLYTAKPIDVGVKIEALDN